MAQGSVNDGGTINSIRINMELEQIKRDILSGKAKKVYYSDKSLWWTHLKTDVIDATEKGRKYLDATNQAIVGGFVDPIGAKIHSANAKDWLKKSLSNPNWYGKHGLKAFVFTHHQNCQQFFSNKWDEYNKKIDLQDTNKSNG